MLKTLLRVRLAAFAAYFTGASRSQKKRSGAQKIAMLLLMLYCFAAFGMLFYTSFSALAGVYAKLSLGWLYFAMYAVAAFALMVFGTVFTAKAQLFEAKDNELLLSLPVRPRDILASRMVSLLLWNLLFGVMVAVPALLAWTQAARLPALGFVSFILLLPALACFSLAVTSLLAWALSLLGSRVRNKSLATIIGSVVFLGLYFAVIFRMNSYHAAGAKRRADRRGAIWRKSPRLARPGDGGRKRTGACVVASCDARTVRARFLASWPKLYPDCNDKARPSESAL